MQYHADQKIITTSVTELVSRVAREGDLGGQRSPVVRPGIASAIHRRLADEWGSTYTPEVEMRHVCRLADAGGGIEVHISGRADGIILDEAGVTVVEVKVLRSRDYYTTQPAHTAQLLCYAYFYADEHGMDLINTQLTYYNLDNGEMRHMLRTCAHEQLRETFYALLARFSRWAALAVDREERRLPAIRAVSFPYDHLRPGQDELALAVFRAIRRGERLFAQAPTGIGKTMSTLYPAVKALGEGKCDRIFYLTAKSSTAREAWSAARRLAACGAQVRTVTLAAREQMCIHAPALEHRSRLRHFCNPADCPYAAGYFRRSADAVYALLTRGFGVTSAMLRSAGEEFCVCPYALSLDLAEHCELIICDYNYLFDPQACLRRFFDAGRPSSERFVFLIDEAHNLPDRARAMYSATLRRDSVERFYARVPAEEKTLDALLGDLILALRRARRFCRSELSPDGEGGEVGCAVFTSLDPQLRDALGSFAEAADDWLREHRTHPFAPQLEELAEQVRDFLTLAAVADGDERRFRYCFEFAQGDMRLRLLCLDPAGQLNARLALGRAAVFFSATLTPPEYFADLLGGSPHDVSLALPSPYPPERLCLAAVDGISTRYADREKSVPGIVRCIAATVAEKPGHYMVYFPSYAYLEAVFARFTSKYPHIPVVAQTRGMDAAAREAFLSAFTVEERKMLIGFAVLGGSFSEGVDLPGRALIGSIIVGCGIPRLSNERGLLAEYYQETCEQGYAYAYVYPGMNKVLQAAGRVIRSEDDRGVVVLIDNRYSAPPYPRLFPAHWSHLRFVGDAASLGELVHRFWAR